MIENLEKYFSPILLNAIESDTIRGPPTMEIELSLIVLFLIVAPKRISQLLSLTKQQFENLAFASSTQIKSKGGYTIEYLVVPVTFSTILNMYLQKFFSKANITTKIFTFAYTQYRNLMITVLKKLYPSADGVNKIFHGFRNYFADLHQNRKNISQFALGHSQHSMTNRYIRTQERLTKNERLQTYINDNFRDTLPLIDSFVSSRNFTNI